MASQRTAFMWSSSIAVMVALLLVVLSSYETTNVAATSTTGFGFVGMSLEPALYLSIERPLVDGWLLMHDAYGSLDLYYTAQIDAGQLFYEDDDDSFSVPTDDDEDRPVTSPNNGACSTSTSTSTICNPTET